MTDETQSKEREAEEAEMSRREFLGIGAALGTALAVIGVSIPMAIREGRIKQRELRELGRISKEHGEIQTAEGKVVDKRITEPEAIGSLFPPWVAGVTKPQYLVDVKFKHGITTVNSREIYEMAERNPKVKVDVRYKERFWVRKTFEKEDGLGKEVERASDGYEIVDVALPKCDECNR
jgi:hypothetical protein